MGGAGLLQQCRTLGAFGFLGAYFLISIAAPVYLKKRQELRGKDVAVCVAAVLLMIIPAVGSVYPVPAAPVSYFPYIFVVYVICGFVRVGIMQGHRSSADRLREVSQEIRERHVDAQTV